MRNSIYEPEKITTEVSTGAVTAGNIVFFGEEIGYAITGATGSGQSFSVGYGGECRFTKEDAGSGQAFAIGDKVYWDAANGRVTKTVGSNKLIGVAKAAALTTATVLERVALKRFVDDIGAS